ncbi:MAG: hypothetical protein ACK2TV_07655 [Anaerolineales bacterium]|jgi:copper chaperone CopZ
MASLSLELPSMYGDHHVIEVRRILLEAEGISEVYASSGFHVVEVEYNSKKITKDKITKLLEDAGYSGDLEIPLEPSIPVTERKGDKYFRHTTYSEQTQNVIGFEQDVGYQGRSQWPIPGFGILKVDQKQTEEN